MALFNPSKDEVRDFFIQTWTKKQNNQILTPLETMAADCIMEHPEYHELLLNDSSRDQDYSVGQGKTNPFLHLSMHLAIQEQLSIDSPPGIRRAYEKLSAKVGPHDAIHEIMECLGQIVWEAQRNRQPPDHEKYLELLNQRSTRL